jgi:hypothetical protein
VSGAPCPPVSFWRESIPEIRVPIALRNLIAEVYSSAATSHKFDYMRTPTRYVLGVFVLRVVRLASATHVQQLTISDPTDFYYHGAEPALPGRGVAPSLRPGLDLCE